MHDQVAASFCGCHLDRLHFGRVVGRVDGSTPRMREAHSPTYRLTGGSEGIFYLLRATLLTGRRMRTCRNGETPLQLTEDGGTLSLSRATLLTSGRDAHLSQQRDAVATDRRRGILCLSRATLLDWREDAHLPQRLDTVATDRRRGILCLLHYSSLPAR